jgi:iron complex outermembrane recepter protein
MTKKLFLFAILVFSSQVMFAQFFKGNLKDEKGNAIVGASIIEVHVENNATTSDANGNFSIIAFKPGSSMRISSLGFESATIPFNQVLTSIVLKRTARSLNTTQIIGSRNTQRSLVTSLAPVEIINVKEVTTKFGQVDLNQLLQYVALSFNSNRQTGSDGADFVDPASLRGLGPDQTLVLINGKRQHQSSLVNLYGSRGRGNNGTDLNVIPASAIDRIEILHDGAAAQYGSDAIAGVINIVLKTRTNNVEVSAGAGMNQATYRYDNKKLDGQNNNMSVNYGIGLGKEDGFVNFTLDRNYHGHTNRADTALGYNYRAEFGDAKIANTSFYANAKLPINKNMHAYSFLGINSRTGDSYAWTREAGDPRNIPSIYPNGFSPIISTNIFDHSFCLGLKSDIGKGWTMDLSNTNGANKFRYTVNHTLNRTLGASTPTDGFDAGGFGLSQNTLNLDFNKNFASWAKGTSISSGAEYRMESYNIVAGAENSWKAYDTFAGGSQGFPGFQPSNALTAKRSNVALYADIESDLSKAWTMAGALRFENYTDFGATLNYKLATRVQISDWLAARGTISSGFRAPSLPQVNFNQTITNYIGGTAQEVLVAKNGGGPGTITYEMGIPNLRQEKSTNMGAGLTAKVSSKFSITVDAYRIHIQDRIVLTGTIGKGTDTSIDNILTAANVAKAQLFTNAATTTSTGIDIVGIYTTYFTKDRLNITLAANFNKLNIDTVYTNTKLAKFQDTYFDLREKYFMKASAPPMKIGSTFDYAHKKLNVVLRFTYFGKVTLADWNYDVNKLNVYMPKMTTDLSFSYKFNNKFGATVGSSNLFNVYPTKFDPGLTESGGAWDPVQMGNNGRYYYFKLRANISTKK